MAYDAKLALEDGTILKGESFGYETIKTGEIVFSTGMTGYVESLTDPSYKGQILMNTYPVQGNYGVNKDWFQSESIKAEGFIVRELSKQYSHRFGEQGLSNFLKEYKIPGISGIDTRALTIKLRDNGNMNGAIATSDIDDEELLAKVAATESIVNMDLVDKVCVKEPKIIGEEFDKRIVILDFGVKNNTIKAFQKREVGVVILPYTYSLNEIMDYDPMGVLVSSGPGNPDRVSNVMDLIPKLTERLPVFGICLGQQLIAKSFGAKIYKMKFGHRGTNQPVKDLISNKVAITSQNHGFSVDADSLKDASIEATQINLSDNTVESIKHSELPVSGVQYHPEAGPGPHDTDFSFDNFVKQMEDY